MMIVKPRYGYVRYGNRECWYCTNYNITTTAKTREKCIAKHLRRLKEYGFIESELAHIPCDITAAEFCKNPWKE